MHHADISTAFLNGVIDGQIFVEWDGKTYELRKALYGLKQSPRLWYERLSKELQKFGFAKLNSTECVFRRGEGTEMVVLMVYVDDLLVLSPSIAEVRKVKTELRSQFKVQDLGILRYYLGIVFERNGNRATLTQGAFCERVLKKFCMDKRAPVPTPMVQNIDGILGAKPSGDAERKKMEIIPYRSVVGSLMYLSCHTRPDIAFAVGVLARHVSDPAIVHWTAAKRILRYLRGTTENGIVIGEAKKRNGKCSMMNGYCDSDWAGDRTDRKSTGGYILLLNGGFITWKSYKQSCVAVSSTEAEYIALSECVREARFLRRILAELDDEIGSVEIAEDNQSCISWTEVQGKRTKHVDVRYHLSREAANAGVFHLIYCPTTEMAADMLTKPLGPQKFQRCAELLPLKIERNPNDSGIGDVASVR